MAKAKKKAKKKSGLRKVRPASYELVWDKPRDNCVFAHHKSGVTGGVLCGVTDAVSVFTDGKVFYILSVNYDEGYACIEILDDADGPLAICFAEPKDMKRMFKGDLADHAPKDIAERLAKECG